MSHSAEEIFNLVCKRAAFERAAFLDGACGADAVLRSQVEALLRGDAAAGALHDGMETAAVDPQASRAAASRGGASPAPRHAPAEQPGEMIGYYKLLELIGEGGFGTVWAAEQREPVKRRVALKIIKLGMDTKQVIARFEAERQALAMMDHPNIAKVLDAGATETGRPFFAMELVKGVPILEYCDTEKLDTDARLSLFMDVCHAIQHAHQKGIIHRDIKPTNVLVTLHDGKPVPKVIDFGIAKATNQELTERTIYTQHRQMIGTPAYMSPEQAEMSGLDIDTRSDIYSLGVLLYELLTGTTPFSNDELMSKGFAEMMRIIRETEPHKPSTRLSSLGETATRTAAQRRVDVRRLSLTLRDDLDWIVMKCLEKDRSRRYDTANGLAMDIQRHLNDEPVTAGPPSARYRLRKFIRRNRGQVIAGGVVAAALVLGVVGTTAGMMWALREKDRAVTAENETQKRADELKQVSEFQSKMLRDIDPAEAGARLMNDIRQRFAAALTKAGVAADEQKSRAEAFGKDLDEVNATDAAVALIDQTILKPAISAVNTQFKEQPVVDAALRQTLADQYRILGRYDDAMILQQQALKTRRSVLGDEDPDTMESMDNAASIYESQGKYAEAEALLREALEKRRKVSGEDDRATLTVMSNLGNLLRSEGKLDEAEPLLRAAVDGCRRVRGPEDRGTLIALNTYGFLLINQGKLAEAEQYWREAYETGKRVFGEDDPDVFVWTNNLGGLLGAQGHPKEADPLYREAYESSRRIRGEEHPQTVTCLRNVANNLRNQGRYAEAEPLVREVLDIRRRVLGPDHPDTLDAMGEMGSVLLAEQKFDEAEPYFREQLEKSRRLLGPEHPDTQDALGNMGYFLQAQGKLEEAEKCNRELLEIRTRTLGPENPDTLMTASNFCVGLLNSGKLDEAETLARDVLDKRTRTLGADHPATLVSGNILSQVLQRQGKLEEAEPYLRAALDGGQRRLGADHPDAMIFAVNLGYLLLDEGKYREAEPVLADVLERSTRVLGLANPTTLSAIVATGELRVYQGKYAEAIELLTPAEDKARVAFAGTRATRLGLLLLDLGQSRAHLARSSADFSAAEANLLEAHGIFVAARGDTHKDTLDCTQALVALYSDWDKTESGKGYDAKAAQWQAKVSEANAAHDGAGN